MSLVPKFLSSRSGNTIVEFAISLPVMMLILVGAADFGRLFFESTALANGAEAGTMYGVQSNVKSGDSTGIESAALTEAADVQSASAVPSRMCDCPDNPGTAVDCLGAVICADYGLPRVYVRTSMTKTFETIVDYPGVPSSTTISQENWMRVR